MLFFSSPLLSLPLHRPFPTHTLPTALFGLQEKRWNVKWLGIKNGNLLFALPMKAAWWLGFLLLVIVPLPTDFAALALASQSIIYPVGAATTVVVGQIVAPKCFFKNEKMTWIEWVGSALICIGAILASAFGAHNNQEYQIADITALYGELPFLILLGVTSLFFILAIYIAHNHKKHKPVWGMSAVVFIPSYLCGVQTISFKSMSELTANALGDSNEWGTSPLPYVFILTVVACATMQLIYINIGGERYQATRYFPAYNATLMVCTCTFGAVFYKEYKTLHPVLFPLGLIVICGGIAFISWRDPTDTSKVVPEAAGGDIFVLSKGVDGDETKTPASDADGVPMATVPQPPPEVTVTVAVGPAPRDGEEQVITTVVPSLALPGRNGEEGPSLKIHVITSARSETSQRSDGADGKPIAVAAHAGGAAGNNLQMSELGFQHKPVLPPIKGGDTPVSNHGTTEEADCDARPQGETPEGSPAEERFEKEREERQSSGGAPRPARLMAHQKIIVEDSSIPQSA